MLKQGNHRNRLSIRKQDISLLILKLDSLQKQCDQADVLAEAKKHVNSTVMAVEVFTHPLNIHQALQL